MSQDPKTKSETSTASPTTTAWHTHSVAEVTQRLEVDPHIGLNAREARRRARRYGPNIIPEHRQRSLTRIFIDQFTDFMILVLIGAAIVSGILGERLDALAIFIIVVLNGTKNRSDVETDFSGNKDSDFPPPLLFITCLIVAFKLQLNLWKPLPKSLGFLSPMRGENHSVNGLVPFGISKPAQKFVYAWIG